MIDASRTPSAIGQQSRRWRFKVAKSRITKQFRNVSKGRVHPEPGASAERLIKIGAPAADEVVKLRSMWQEPLMGMEVHGAERSSKLEPDFNAPILFATNISVVAGKQER